MILELAGMEGRSMARVSRTVWSAAFVAATSGGLVGATAFELPASAARTLTTCTITALSSAVAAGGTIDYGGMHRHLHVADHHWPEPDGEHRLERTLGRLRRERHHPTLRGERRHAHPDRCRAADRPSRGHGWHGRVERYAGGHRAGRTALSGPPQVGRAATPRPQAAPGWPAGLRVVERSTSRRAAR